MFDGIGDLRLITKQIGDESAAVQRMMKLGLLRFTYTSEADIKRSQKFVKGKLRNASSSQGQITDTLEFAFNEADWAHIGLSLGVFPKTAASAILPTLRDDTVLSSNSFEVADGDITALNLDQIFVYIPERGPWGEVGFMPRAATPASPADGEVGIDTTANKLIFNAAQANAPVVYQIPITKNNIQYYGGAGTATKWGEFEFLFESYNPLRPEPDFGRFPKVQIIGRPTWSFTNDVPEIVVQGEPGLPAGWEEPFEYYNVSSAD
ncbi:MAG: hypothetical protein ACFB0C_15680 [Leptolyngbyaceae cyanobacterium]